VDGCASLELIVHGGRESAGKRATAWPGATPGNRSYAEKPVVDVP
jgi:hypothetical protein